MLPCPEALSLELESKMRISTPCSSVNLSLRPPSLTAHVGNSQISNSTGNSEGHASRVELLVYEISKLQAVNNLLMQALLTGLEEGGVSHKHAEELFRHQQALTQEIQQLLE